MATIIPCGGFEIDDNAFELDGNILKAKNTSTADGFFVIRGELSVDSVSGDLIATIEEEFADIQAAFENGQIPVALIDNKAESGTQMLYLSGISDSGIIFRDTGRISESVFYQMSLFVTLNDEQTVCTVETDTTGGSSPENSDTTE